MRAKPYRPSVLTSRPASLGSYAGDSQPYWTSYSQSPFVLRNHRSAVEPVNVVRGIVRQVAGIGPLKKVHRRALHAIDCPLISAQMTEPEGAA